MLVEYSIRVVRGNWNARSSKARTFGRCTRGNPREIHSISISGLNDDSIPSLGATASVVYATINDSLVLHVELVAVIGESLHVNIPQRANARR